MDIVKGKINAPVRAVAYGPEGIGKSTFAAAWPAPLFVDAEGGTARLAVDRIHPLSWAAVTAAVEELAKDPQGYKTLVIDTADWAEKLLVEHVLATVPNDKGQTQKSIEGYGYGKGYTHLAEAWKRILDRVAILQQATGMHVLFLAHAALRHVDPPDEQAYDRWEMKLGKQSCQILKEWADLVLFLNYKTIVVETDGKAKAQGGRRIMYSDHHPCWDAKNRFGLQPEMPLEFAPIAGIFSAAPLVMPVAAAAAPAAPAAANTAPEDGDKTALLVQLGQLMRDCGVSKEDLGAELSRKGVCPADTNPRQMNNATLKRVIAGWQAITHNITVAKQRAA